jgi:hypothetical protein
MCYTEVDDRPNKAQQIAYNNFFKVGEPASANQGKRNSQYTQELLAISQQFMDQHGKLLAGNNRNQ